MARRRPTRIKQGERPSKTLHKVQPNVGPEKHPKPRLGKQRISREPIGR